MQGIMRTFQVAKYEFVLSSEQAAPPSRRRFKKSKGGCAACKKRKVKCDEERPVCYNCSVYYRGARACEWPETKQRASLANSSRSVPSTALIIHKEPVSINLSSQREEKLSKIIGTSTSICRDVASDRIDPFGAFPQTSIPKAQELLHHYVTVAAWEYFPISRGPKAANPYLESLAATDPLLFHSNLQVSARSLERRQGVKWSSYTDVIARECVRLLRERVQDPVLGISNHTLGAIARMMEVEHDRGNTRAVQMHLDGITSIVKLRGGLDALRRSCTLTMMAVVWRTLLVTDRCPFVPLVIDKLEDPTWLRDILFSSPYNTDFPSAEDLSIDKTTWDGLVTVKRHSQTIEKTLKAGDDPGFIATESLAGLLWQRYQYLPLVPGVEPLCDATRLATILFLCISNQNYRSFLFNHPSGRRSCEGISSHFRTSLQAFLCSDIFCRLDASSRRTDALSFIVWLFMIGIINSYELPDRQWFVDGVVPFVNRMGICSWREMKESVKRIMWLDVWHDGVGEQIWEEVASKTRAEQTLISTI